MFVGFQTRFSTLYIKTCPAYRFSHWGSRGSKCLLWSSFFPPFCDDGSPYWICRRTYYKSPLYWPFLINRESKGRADLLGSLDEGDKIASNGEDCRGACQTRTLQWSADIKTQMVKKVVSYCLGRNVSCSLPYTGLRLLTSAALCVLPWFYVAVLTKWMLWLSGY